jgi:acetylornithine deacetylase/succinyl-diaminopimelate desuccinylase-like protein
MFDAEYALNTDGGGGTLSGGKPVAQFVQASEKVFADFRLEATNPGGHSSLPRADNAITELAEALVRIGHYSFPLRLNEVTRAFLLANAKVQPALAADMRAVAQPVPDSAAAARLSAKDPYLNSILRTTCVATLLQGGHADNALPQLAAATVNCRMAPDDPTDSVLATLQRLAGDKVKVKLAWDVIGGPVSPLRPDVMGVVERLTKQQFPGAIVTPEMSTGASDGVFTRNAGIPTYGISSIFVELNEPSRAHGRDERVGVKAFHDEVRFWYDMVKALAGPEVHP